MDSDALWQQVLAALAQHPTISHGAFAAILGQTHLVAQEHGQFIVGAPHAFACNKLDQQLRPLVVGTLQEVTGTTSANVRFVVAPEPAPAETEEPMGKHRPPSAPAISRSGRRGEERTSPPAPVSPATGRMETGWFPESESAVRPSSEEAGMDVPPPQPTAVARPRRQGKRRQKPAATSLPLPRLDAPTREREAGYTGLQARYIFQNFIVGKSSQLAHAATRAVADNPAGAYNPLFLYGGVGLGKTHLLHAIGHQVLRDQPGQQVLYVTTETFTNDFINHVRHGRAEAFRGKYRTTDILLIDDVQFLAGKEQTQEEFFHTFNALHNENRQIVLTSDRPPAAISALEDRLRSRFAMGLIADIQPPDFETRVAILRAKAALMQVEVPPAVLDYIAHRVAQNIRELEGALTRVVATARLTNAPLTADRAAAALTEVVTAPPPKATTPEQIMQSVVSFFQTTVEALCGKARDKQVVLPRQVAMYLMREDSGASLVEIGRHLGGRDHSTVLHGWGKITREIERDPGIREQVQAVRALLATPGV